VNAEGKLTSDSKQVAGTNIVEIKNDKGQIIGRQVLGYGGKVVKEYDDQSNLVAYACVR